jgi:hypothetical protein
MCLEGALGIIKEYFGNGYLIRLWEGGECKLKLSRVKNKFQGIFNIFYPS